MLKNHPVATAATNPLTPPLVGVIDKFTSAEAAWLQINYD